MRDFFSFLTAKFSVFLFKLGILNLNQNTSVCVCVCVCVCVFNSLSLVLVNFFHLNT